MTDLLTRLLELEAAATKGPWFVSSGSLQFACVENKWVASTMGIRGDKGAANIALIVAMRNALPDLLATIEQEQLGRLRLEEFAEVAAAHIEALEREIEGLREALEPFAMVALEGRDGGEFIICKVLYADMKGWRDSPPRESHLHKEDFVRARTALTAPSMKENEDETRG